ncbi:unnamed protein product [Ambrosiozyma monospora]|uniref:Unnamed protein product n=1 Tax=Ambrosiozyma monospora TaxID=43982 RepID=A0ACB5T0X0_AMBMO|nr:unnamed protein product [Ambrosiozyma monospora]
MSHPTETTSLLSDNPYANDPNLIDYPLATTTATATPSKQASNQSNKPMPSKSPILPSSPPLNIAGQPAISPTPIPHPLASPLSSKTSKAAHHPPHGSISGLKKSPTATPPTSSHGPLVKPSHKPQLPGVKTLGPGMVPQRVSRTSQKLKLLPDDLEYTKPETPTANHRVLALQQIKDMPARKDAERFD